jgi:hypothetical protein
MLIIEESPTNTIHFPASANALRAACHSVWYSTRSLSFTWLVVVV